jgi:hypothetical protein
MTRYSLHGKENPALLDHQQNSISVYWDIKKFELLETLGQSLIGNNTYFVKAALKRSSAFKA